MNWGEIGDFGVNGGDSGLILAVLGRFRLI